MKITRMSDGAVLNAVLEDRGCIVPGYDRDHKPFPAWTLYFECGEVAAYHQHDLRLLRRGPIKEGAFEGLRSFFSGMGFEAREDDLPVPQITPLSLLRATRIASGETIEIPWEHRGDIMPGFDANQNPFPAVTSYFEINGEASFCFTNKLIAVGTGVEPLAQHREDCVALLAEHGLRISGEAIG